MTTLFRRQSQRRHDRGNFIAERRRNWVLPVIAALLALLLMWKDGRAAEVVRGVIKSTSAYVQVRFAKGPLIEFTTRFDLPDIPNREGWR